MLLINSALALNASALAPDEATQLLKKADTIKTSDHAEFMAIMQRLDAQPPLPPLQQKYLRYLHGWKHAYDGDYKSAIPLLETVADEPGDVTLRFRAGVTVANALALAVRYDEAFSQLGQLLALLPQVTDRYAREQGLSVAAFLYNQVGEYDLGLNYARTLERENWAGRGICRGGQLKVEALYKSGGLRAAQPQVEAAIDACVKLGELLPANRIRAYIARQHMDEGRFDDAIRLLQAHYEEIRRSRYRRAIAEYDSLLAQAYRQTGDSELVQKFASSAIGSGVHEQYTEPLVQAFRLLYLLAKERGDAAAALAFHEQYAAADNVYLDDVSARQLAYERVKHETAAGKLQIDTLNTENQVLQLQRENNRLYIALLLICLGFIVFWAYLIKRSQLHFRKLSQQDGLTGIANRPHFIEQAEGVLANARKMQQEVCVVLCDLDHFKAINDRHGHAAGDFVLRQTVTACRAHLRDNDIFGRFGGEEFGIVLPGCNLDAARLLCEQLRLAIVEVACAQQGMEAKVSASFGIATTGLFDYELRQLLAHADAALYQAKRAGRNCVIAYDMVDAADVDALVSIAAQQRVGVPDRM